LKTEFKQVVELGCHYINTVLEDSKFSDSEIWVVDAVPEFLEKLPSKKNLTKICSAVTPDYTGKKTMRGILLADQVKHNLPDWSTTMSTLNNSHPTISYFGWENYVTEFEVDCLSIKDLWIKHNIPKNPDFLSVDLEGLDYKIVTCLIKNNIKPEVIRFESKLMSDNELHDIKNFLASAGYKHIVAGIQTDFNDKPYNHWAWINEQPDLEML